MYNPFSTQPGSALTDEQLIAASLNGDKNRFEELILRHQGWIYNICLRMVGNQEDAADLTQEILIKVVTSLGSFERKSSFRTWLYRIVKNNVINWEIKKSKLKITSFQQFGETLDNAPYSEIPDNNYFAADKAVLIKETKFRCMTGMLLCLDKKQRLVFILGELFSVTDTVGSEIMEITSDNFRTLLSRARAQLYNFMDEKCGLENKNNPCRCAKKTKAFIAAGIVDPHSLKFAVNYQKTVGEMAESSQGKMEVLLHENYQMLYREHPYLQAPSLVEGLRIMLSSEPALKIFNI